MKHPVVSVPKLAWLYSCDAGLHDVFLLLCFLCPMDGKAEMQTFILNYLKRSLYKRAFSFRPLFLILTAFHFECAIVSLCITVNFDLF